MRVDLDALRERLEERLWAQSAYLNTYRLSWADAVAEAKDDPRSLVGHSVDLLRKNAAELLSDPLSDLIAKAGRVEAAEKERDEARSKQAVPLTEEQIEARRNRAHDAVIRRLRAERDAALARATAAEAESERLRARQDAALRGAIRNWSARLHIPVTRMMSRALREEFAAALAATQPDSTEAPASAAASTQEDQP